MDDLITIKEAASRFGCSDRAIWSGLERRRIRRYTRNARVLVSAADVKAWRATAKRGRPARGTGGR